MLVSSARGKKMVYACNEVQLLLLPIYANAGECVKHQQHKIWDPRVLVGTEPPLMTANSVMNFFLFSFLLFLRGQQA